MRGLEVTDGEIRYRADLPPPAAVPGESRVRVLKAGICATDLALVRGYMGFSGIPGHEFVGIAIDGPLAGQRVVGEINAACGACATCQAGLGRHCPSRSVLGILRRPGCFAEELSLPVGNLLPVPDSITDEAAVFTEPLAAAFELSEQVLLVEKARGLVIGDGRLGLLCAHVLTRHRLHVTVCGRHPERQQLLAPDTEHVTELPMGCRFDVVVEATGDPAVIQSALPLVRPRGTLILKTTSERRPALDLAPVVIDEITIVGSRCGRFEPALEALASHGVDVEAMVEARYPLERGVEALARASEKGVLKILLDVT